MGRLASRARHHRRLPRRAGRDASRLGRTSLGDAARSGGDLRLRHYNIATRYLAAFDPPEVTQTYTPLAGAIVMAPFALAAWQWPQDALVWLLFASLGFWGGLGHWLLILAHRHAPAPVLAPFIYLGLIWMSVAGLLIFGDVPTLWTLSG